MIIGQIDEQFEARVLLSVLTRPELETTVNFLVDTGFNGFLAVTPILVEQLNLPLGPVQRGMTADGRTGFYDTAELRIVWHDRPTVIRAQVLDEPLIGTRLLAGHQLIANWQPRGEFRLAQSPEAASQ
jgi:clan AA aspartic protease